MFFLDVEHFIDWYRTVIPYFVISFTLSLPMLYHLLCRNNKSTTLGDCSIA